MAGNQKQAGTRSLTVRTSGTPGTGAASPWRRAKIGAIIFGIVLALGMALALFGGGGGKDDTGTPETPADSTPTSQAGGSGPGAKAKSVKSGVPVGYPRTKDGAAAAAVNYQVARSSPGYFTDEALRHQVLKTVMTTSALGNQQAQDDQTVKGLMAALKVTAKTAPDMVMRAASLGTSVRSYSEDAATVRVWMSEVVGVPTDKSKMPVSGTYSTYTVILQWQDGDWKVATIDQADGPTPLVAADQSASSTDEMRLANKEFEAPRYAG
ncbi:hypothetical protein AR457_37980 [Streptomyces agglomeratus]|uniref:hypothetical protein n=1 Tax=Streptomyces agglomeratus TaxID=285458 RepID=UPI0008525B2E|nr:hypothetical protein [Streptomyces agglomeratus]OEJ22994.1 hypothetical protein AR457_37980 [Streptomyces agglomeratus]OEJ36869.1 hypothetical protein BGK70_00375 [Streptomyces agglomeratus]